jgi:hypothetical protein
MQHRIAPFDQFIDAAPIGEIAADPGNTCVRFAMRTRQRANGVARPSEVFE